MDNLEGTQLNRLRGNPLGMGDPADKAHNHYKKGEYDYA